MNYKQILQEYSNDDKLKIKVGDVINLKRWYNDVWSEVLSVNNDYILHCEYNKYGDKRWTRLSHIKEIENVSTVSAAKIELKSDIGAILYLVDGKYGMYGRKWPTKMTKHSKAYSNFPETHPDGVIGRPKDF